MRVVPGGVEPVGEGEAKVVAVEFDEGRTEFGGKVKLFGEGVRLELKAPTERRHEEGEDLVVG